MREVMRRADVSHASHLPERVDALADTDRQHWDRYALGKSVVGHAWHKRIDEIFPGTSDYLRQGPRSIFGAVLGTKGDRARFLETLVGRDAMAEIAYIGPNRRADIFGLNRASLRTKAVNGLACEDAFFACTVFHLGAVKEFKYVGTDYFLAFDFLDRLPSDSLADRALVREWEAFLASTVVEVDPFGEPTRSLPEISVVDIEQAGELAKRALFNASRASGVPAIVYRPHGWPRNIRRQAK